MDKKSSFGLQLFIVAGFFVFFYMFFALATSIYLDYKFQTEIKEFEADIEVLAKEAREKPQEIARVNSPQWIDQKAKESLNLLSSGEKMILLPSEDNVVEEGEVELMTDFLSPSSIINQPNPVQWREYFFGQTLSVQPDSDFDSGNDDVDELRTDG